MANNTETLTQNRDVDYILKDFNSAVDAMISFATVNFGSGTSANRLWTNFNTDSFSRNWLEIVAYIADTLFFYLDNQATQSYLQTATIRSAVRDIAKQFGFTPATASSASGNATFTFTSAGTVPRGFRVSSESGVEFYVTDDVVAGAAGEYTGTVLQGEIRTETFTSVGIQNEEFEVSADNVIIDDNALNALDLTPQVTVNGNEYTLVESFIRSNGTDSAAIVDSFGDIIGGGGRVFQLEERPNGTPFIRFGDGIFGRKLVSGETIIITYRTGGGTQGNIDEGTLNTLVDSLSFVSAVTNGADFSGGADEQSIEELRDLIPASLRTLERAVAESDYSDILTANFSEVFDASTEVNNIDPGIDLNIYVVPQGTGITSITDNTLLVNRLSDYIDRRKMVTVQFQILDAYGVDVLIRLEIFVSSTTSKTTVEQSINSALSNYFDLSTGGPNGSGIGFAQNILLKDICAILEDISGIERFEIKQLSYRPRIENNVQGLLTEYNSSEVSIFQNVSESEWLAGAAGSETEASGTVLFDNASSTGFAYNSSTGKLSYDFSVDLESVSPGDLFRNGPGLPEITEVQTVGDGVGTEEVTKVTTRADQQGVEEETEITTVENVGSVLIGTYFVIYDIAGSVGVWFNDSGSPVSQPSTGANRHIEVDLNGVTTANDVASALQTELDGDAEFSAGVVGNLVTVTNDKKVDVFDAADGSVPTNFTFTTTIDGANPDSLDGTYFLLYDDSGSVAFWFDIDNSGTTIPSGASAAARAVEVSTVNSNDPANDVASKLQTIINGDAKFSASVTNNEVTVTDASVGQRTDASDGIPPTKFTLETITQGANADLLDGTYFDMEDDSGAVRVWFDVDNLSTPPGAPAGGRLLEVDISSGDIANDVASALQSAVDLDAKFSASVVNNVVTIEDASAGSRDDAADNDTGFTLTITQQGIEDDVDYTIFSVDIENSELYLLEDLSVNPVAGLNAGGSIRNGNTSFESYKVFKKLLATATNLSINSITDSSVDLSVNTGTGTALDARTLIDNDKVFIPGEYATGEFYLIDGSGNIWEIENNESNTLTTSITAVNDAGITSVSDGDYNIVPKFTAYQILFNGSIFNIQYNTHNTFYSVGGQFIQIGTIGDSFEVSIEQTNLGSLGINVDPISFDSPTGRIRLNGSPDLEGISSEYVLVDNSGQIFNITSIDDRALPSVTYSQSNQNDELILKASGVGSQYSQGFQVSETDTYSAINLYLRREGNIVGNLTAKIVNDDGTGLPDSTSIIAISRSINVTNVSDSTLELTPFTFSSPPTLSAGVQYHIILSGDVAYVGSQQDNVLVFDNTPFVAYTYNSISGALDYASTVNLSSVEPGNFFEDNDGNLFEITNVDDSNNSLTLAAGLPLIVGINGHVYANDSVLIGVDNLSPTFATGEMSQWDGAFWSNSTLGPNQFVTEHDAIFSIEGPKSIVIESNLTPVLGEGATISKRYYDDENEISFILGISDGTITSASDLNAYGKGTVGGSPDTFVDHFIWRTSRFADDIINLRLMEIPQLSVSDLTLDIFGGIE